MGLYSAVSTVSPVWEVRSVCAARAPWRTKQDARLRPETTTKRLAAAGDLLHDAAKAFSIAPSRRLLRTRSVTPVELRVARGTWA